MQEGRLLYVGVSTGIVDLVCVARNRRNLSETDGSHLTGLVNKKDTPIPEPRWVRVADRLPTDGQVVLVRGQHGRTPTRATFHATPVARWETDDSFCQPDYFEEWAPLA